MRKTSENITLFSVSDDTATERISIACQKDCGMT